MVNPAILLMVIAMLVITMNHNQIRIPMGKYKEKINPGDRFGRLTILREVEPYVNGSNRIRRFVCKCGNIVTMKITDIKQSKVPSCGCTSRGKTSLIGKRFGRLFVIGYNTKTLKWKCKCICGGTKEVLGCDLKNGRVKSCGCLRRKDFIAKTTGYPIELTDSKLYPFWVGALSKSYTTKRITLCKEWRDNFIPFYLWCKHNGYTEDSKVCKIDDSFI